MATIRRVTIHRLRNVKPGCTFELHPGLNVLLGQNGTGKTTLLQWMADFMSGNLESWSKEPYRVEVEMEAAAGPDTARMRLLIDNEISELPRDSEAQHGLDRFVSLMNESPRTGLVTTRLAIELGDRLYEVEGRPNHLSLRANDAPLVESDSAPPGQLPTDLFTGTILKAALLLRQGIANPNSPNHAAQQQAWEHLKPLMKDVVLSYPLSLDRFDESLGFFNRIVEGRESHAQVVLYPSDRGNHSRLIPDQLFEIIENKLRGSDSDIQALAFSSEEVQGFLAAAVRLFRYRAATLHLALLEKEMSGDKAILIYGNLRFTFLRHDGSIVGHDALSYGQKRMLSFLYYLALNPYLIIVDELVNGLHHAWIEACIEEIGGRQGLLTSQNPLLLDYLTFDSADEVRRRFILCRSEREDGREQLVWRNPTQDEAESFFRAYQAGIQHVGEILVDKGLW